MSSTCKREDAKDHAALIQATLLATKNCPILASIRTVSLASDGEARRGKSLVLLTFKGTLSMDSPIYELLSPLKFLDLHVGDDDITADKDYKHVAFKRPRNLLLRERGTLVHGFQITPAIIRQHLVADGHSQAHVNALLKPEDKQDVKLAFDLLQDIWALKPLDEISSESSSCPTPGFIKARQSLCILGRLLYHLIMPYVCVDLSLAEQLTYLSFAAHLTLALFVDSNAGRRFFPSQLFIDIMIMIKNVFFCVAKTKIDDPEGCFWLLLLGTDRLEALFGILRSIVGNDNGLDMIQVGV